MSVCSLVKFVPVGSIESHQGNWMILYALCPPDDLRPVRDLLRRANSRLGTVYQSEQSIDTFKKL